MESSAIRLTRVLVAFFLTLLVTVSIAILDGGEYWSKGPVMIVPASMSVASALLIILLVSGKGREHGSWPSDSWFSREGEGEMRMRLENEMEEGSLSNLGSNWAKMEMGHLESKHSEE